ncbi:MAG: winged helix DNA-binding protein [Chromatiaceae bacterium]|nr:winged helix DNA-binding protein [Chromatiaceae bacterium]
MSDKPSIVSSAHLAADSRMSGLSELEFALITCGNAFNRWVVRCAAAAEAQDLTTLDVLVLHNVNHRARDKRLSEICFLLNVEDTHLVNYSLKKLQRFELVEGTRRGKEVIYRTSNAGRELCQRYRAVRESCLLDALLALGGPDNKELSTIAQTLRALSGLYDQAARSASSL